MVLAIVGIVLLAGGGVCLFLAGVPAAAVGVIVFAVSALAEAVKKALPKKEGTQ